LSEHEATDFVTKLAKNKSIDWDGANKYMSNFTDKYLQNLTSKDFIQIQTELKFQFNLSEAEAANLINQFITNAGNINVVNQSVNWDGANKYMSNFTDKYLQNLTSKDFIQIQTELKFQFNLSEAEAANLINQFITNTGNINVVNQSVNWDGANKYMSNFTDKYLKNMTSNDFIQIQTELKIQYNLSEAEAANLINQFITNTGNINVVNQSVDLDGSNKFTGDINDVQKKIEDSYSVQNKTMTPYEIKEEIRNLYDVKNEANSIAKMAQLLEKHTNVLYDAETYREYQILLLDELRGITNDKNAAEITSRIFERIINDRGGYIEIGKIEGIKILALNGCDEKYIEKINQYINKLPAKMKKDILQISICDLYNPYDPYWTIQYATPKFESVATGGHGEINIWNNGKKMYMGGFSHEAGHCIDTNWKYSSSYEWINAALRDEKICNVQGVSPYACQAINAAGTYCEDFAESIRLFLENEMNFKAKYPNRYVIIKGLLQ